MTRQNRPVILWSVCEGRELRIHMNSTRRARWLAKLGIARPIVVNLRLWPCKLLVVASN